MATVRCALRTQAAWDAMTPAERAVYTAHFTSLTAWQTARARDLVTAGDIEQLEVFDDWAAGYWEGSVFAFNGTWVTDAANHICIRAAAGHECNGNPDSGARFVRPASFTSWTLVFDPSPSEELHIHWYDLAIVNLGLSGIISSFPDENATYKRCCLKAEYTTFQYPGNHKLHWCVLIVDEYGILEATWNNPTNGLYNCVLRATTPNSVGISGSSGTDTAINCVFVGFGTDASATLAAGSTNNATTNAVASDASITLLSVDAATAFVDDANHDYHTPAGSVLIGAGVNQYDPALPQADIDGDPLPAAGAWPIGYDFVPSGIITAGGDLTGGQSTASGSAAKIIIGSGSVSSAAALLSGDGSVVGAVNASGDLSASPSVLSGIGAKTILSVGSVQPATAQLYGSGSVAGVVFASGSMTAGSAAVSGSSTVTVQASGNVIPFPASVSGSGSLVGSIQASGDLSAGSAALSGSGSRIIWGAGSFISGAPVISGGGWRIISGDGALQARAASLSGSGGAAVDMIERYIIFAQSTSREVYGVGYGRTIYGGRK